MCYVSSKLRVVVERELEGCGAQAHCVGLRTFQLDILFKHIGRKDVAFQQEGSPLAESISFSSGIDIALKKGYGF